uniref:Vacuolar protein sorting-associated protein 33B n=1 Tax=Micrurus carvalhoi TaxID=3147026 RepID=A0A2H6NKR1_9SAUR
MGLIGVFGEGSFFPPRQLWLDSTLSQVLERRGWLGLEEVARLLGGHEFVTATEEPRPPASQQVILAVFLGGCTFSEVAALRFLGRERGLRFIILTTAITNSARLLESTMEMRM